MKACNRNGWIETQETLNVLNNKFDVKVGKLSI